MGKVFIHVVMSLDGYISKLDEADIDWMFQTGEGDALAARMMDEIGAVVIGNKGFAEGSMSAEALPYGGLPVPQFVITHHQRPPETIGPLTFQFVTGGVERAVRLAQAAADEKRVALLGASICQQALQAGLVDELVIHLVPLLLGDGIRLFEPLGREYALVREEVVTTGQLTSLRFSVTR